MMARKLRSPAELQKIYEEDPELERIYESLKQMEHIEIHPDGTGDCVFKVYLKGNTGGNQQLARIYSPLSESLIAWSNQTGAMRDVWYDLWAPYVRSPENTHCSRLKPGTTSELFLKLFEQHSQHYLPTASEVIKIDPPQSARVHTTMSRNLRTPEELVEIFTNDPGLEELYKQLSIIENIVIKPDGTGACVFKLYIKGKTEPNTAFLWLYTPANTCYATWGKQDANMKNVWQGLCASYVKEPRNADGSFLAKEVRLDIILQLVKHYANYCVPPDTPQAIDVESPLPGRVETTTLRIIRDTTLAQRIKALHGYKCQICGFTIELPDGSQYAEAHHIQPLGLDGPDVEGNIIVLCPNHHAMCDYGAIAIDLNHVSVHPSHTLSNQYIDYHNSKIYKPPYKPSAPPPTS